MYAIITVRRKNLNFGSGCSSTDCHDVHHQCRVKSRHHHVDCVSPTLLSSGSSFTRHQFTAASDHPCLMKTVDRSVETLGGEVSLKACFVLIHFHSILFHHIHTCLQRIIIKEGRNGEETSRETPIKGLC